MPLDGRITLPSGRLVGGVRAGLSWPTLGQMTLAVVMLGLVWRTVRYALAFPLWGDEAFLAVNFLTRGFAGLSRPLEFGQVAPPGFLWTELAAVRALGSSEWALRLVPFLAGVASLLVFWRFCREVATRRAALLAVALLAASFFPVRHATEVKPYAVDLFVALVVTSLGWSVWRDPRPVGRWLALFAAASAGVWCSYTAVFPVATVGLLLLARGWSLRSAAILGRAAALALISGASWAVMMVMFARQQLAETAWLKSIWADGFPPLSRPWRLPYWLLEAHTSGMMAYPYGGRSFTGTGTALLVAAGAIALWRRAPRRPLLFLLLGPLPLAMAAAALGRYPYGGSTRLMLYMAPAVCLLAGEGLVVALWASHTVRRGSIVVAGALALIPIVCTLCDVSMPYRRRDDLQYRAFVRRLAERTGPGDRWIVFDGVDTLPKQPWVMTAVWVQRVAKLRFYLLSLAPASIRWESNPQRIEPSAGGRTWLILHDHGFGPLYPHALHAAYAPVVAARLGPARSTQAALPVGSNVDVHEFGPKPEMAVAPGPAVGITPVRR